MKYLYSNKHWELNKEYNIDKLLYLMIDRPSKIYFIDDFIWFKNNNKRQYHRDYDLPSVSHFSDNGMCALYWNKNNKCHRKNGKPAIIYSNSVKKYYMNDRLIKEKI